MSNLLEIKDLSVEYRTRTVNAHAVNHASFTIRRGEALGLVGESGAGKTTTALSILNLLPKETSRITSGEILFKDEDLLSAGEKKLSSIRGSEIAMIFQNPLTSLNPLFTVGEQIAMVLQKHKNMHKKEAHETAGHLLEAVGIPAYRATDYPHQFSGGMRQRVGIAAALACEPELIIADEPTTALDVTIQAQILEIIKELLVEHDCSLLMITHNLGIVSEICQNVAVMYGGTIIEYGDVKEVFACPLHHYTRGLLGAIPKLHGARERLNSIPGTVANAQDLPEGCSFHPRCSRCTQKCKEKQPPLTKINDNHFVACWDAEV